MKKSVKLGLKIGGLSIAWIPASVGALATIDVCTSLNSRAPLNKRFFRDAVVKKPALASTPVNQIAMLGSHDALSDSITINSRNDPYSPNTTRLSELARYVGPGALVRLSRAQADDIYTQLNAGVRYVDARITCINGQYYTHHTLISNTLEHYLEQILRWLNENPGEFIFFHIYYFNYDGLNLKTEKGAESPEYIAARDNAWAKLRTFIDNYRPYGQSLFEYDYTLKNTPEDCHISKITYNDVTNNGDKAGAIIYFSSDDPEEASPTEWCSKHLWKNGEKKLKTCCAHSMKASKVIACNKDFINEIKNKSDRNEYIRYVQTQTTPNIDEIPQTIVGWSLIQKAHDHNPYMLRKSGIDWNEAFKYVPIYMSDFVTDNTNGFCQEIINKAFDFNTKLS